MSGILLLGLGGMLRAWAEAEAPMFPPLGALPGVPVPADNPITPPKIALGRLLFFDNRLAGDTSTSCASCHDPRLGWGDGNALSRGYPGTQHWRNSQTIINSAYLAKYFWGGEKTSLEAQADSALSGNLAGNGDPAMIEERLAQIPEYVHLFREAFGAERPSYDYILRAIAAFERAEAISNDSPFDRYMRGDRGALSEGTLRGMALFQGKAGCNRCHNGPLLTDESYHNIGVPKNDLFESDPQRQIALRFQHYARGVSEELYRKADRDLGLYYTTKRAADKGKFRTPPLRYLLYTAPYMHNGVFWELEEVIDFYDKGGGEDLNKSPLMRPLNLTEDEKEDLSAFLESLSGSEVRMEPPELPSYQPMR
jgi:cytochrome c peroxidase